MTKRPTPIEPDARQPGNPALAALAHPLALVCAAALLLNALVWQRLWPSWWTGKIGDVAALVIVPLLATLPLGALGRRLSTRAFAGWVALPIALAFAAVKLWPAANGAVLALGASLGLALKLRLDPSDALALPAVVAAIWVWGHPWRPLAAGRAVAPRRLAQAAGLALATLAVLADTAAPIDLGIICLTRDGAALLAVREMDHNSESPFSDGKNQTVYRSADSGLTWQPDAQTDAKKLACSAGGAWPMADPGSAGSQLFYVAGQGIYHSSDQGQTMQLEQPMKNLEDYELDEANHALIVAGGTDGIWVKTAAGQWQQTLNLKQP